MIKLPKSLQKLTFLFCWNFSICSVSVFFLLKGKWEKKKLIRLIFKDKIKKKKRRKQMKRMPNKNYIMRNLKLNIVETVGWSWER